MPEFQMENETGFTFGDIAGLHDTGGELIELVNSFVTKKIFQMAKWVKILILIT